MSNRAFTVTIAEKRPIPSWRFVAGVFAHFAVPAFVVIVPITCLLTHEGPAWSDAIGQLPAVSGWFLAGYTALAVVSVMAAAIFDPVSRWRRERREARDPRSAAIASSQRLTRAIADGRRGLDDRSRLLLDSLRRPLWDHADPRFQALTNDLAEVVRTSCIALASAAPERRPALRGLAAESLGRIDDALTELAGERARLNEGDAMVVARYVRLRHAHSDFASDEP